MSRLLISELHDVNPDAMLAVGLNRAVIGYTLNDYVAVYSAEKCVDIVSRRDGCSPEEAEEHLWHNTFCAYVGKNTPIFVRTLR